MMKKKKKKKKTTTTTKQHTGIQVVVSNTTCQTSCPAESVVRGAVRDVPEARWWR